MNELGLNIRYNIFGAEHILTADSYNYVGVSYHGASQFDVAI